VNGSGARSGPLHLWTPGPENSTELRHEHRPSSRRGRSPTVVVWAEIDREGAQGQADHIGHAADDRDIDRVRADRTPVGRGGERIAARSGLRPGCMMASTNTLSRRGASSRRRGDPRIRQVPDCPLVARRSTSRWKISNRAGRTGGAVVGVNRRAGCRTRCAGAYGSREPDARTGSRLEAIGRLVGGAYGIEQSRRRDDQRPTTGRFSAEKARSRGRSRSS